MKALLLAGVTAVVPLRGARVVVDGPALQREVVALADGARTSLDVEFLSFYGDASGWTVANALIAAARRGVAVRVLIDSLYLHTSSNRPEPGGAGGPGMVDALRAAGADVRASNPFSRGNGPLQRDHRKIVEADGLRGLVTGYQPGDEQLSWHDVGIAVEGPEIAALLAQAFEGSWAESGGRPGAAAASAAGACGAEGFSRTTARLDLTDPQIGDATGIRDENVARIDAARRNVYIENAFFTDRKVFAALERAARRGVDVRAVFSRDNVHFNAKADARLAYPALVAAGVKVYERPGMSHTKALSVDGAWASVGSANMMPMLEDAQNEDALEFQGPLVAELEAALFLPDFAASQLIGRAQLRADALGRVVYAPFAAADRAVAGLERVEEAVKSGARGLLDR